MDYFLPKSMVFTPKLWISHVFGVVSPFPCSIFSIGGCRWLQRDSTFMSRSIKFCRSILEGGSHGTFIEALMISNYFVVLNIRTMPLRPLYYIFRHLYLFKMIWDCCIIVYLNKL
ncbi:hypothetical protein LguiA_029756 [Lonicera macranthoides]